jgi:hypothetical protein
MGAAIALTMIPLVANAQGGGTFTVRGVGLDSCGAWSQSRQGPAPDDPQHDGRRLIEEAWVLGYVSSFDEHSLVPIGRVDNAALLAWVDSYCAGHPLDSVQQASDSLIREFGGRVSHSP